MRLSILLAVAACSTLTANEPGPAPQADRGPTEPPAAAPANPKPEKPASEVPQPKGLSYDDLDFQDELFVWKGEDYPGPTFSLLKNSKRLHMQMEFKAGRRHGVQTEYFENGKRKTIATFKEGVQDGLNVYWDEEGNKVLERIWKDGEVIAESPEPSGETESKAEDPTQNARNP
jgi:hypothetical protein